MSSIKKLSTLLESAGNLLHVPKAKKEILASIFQLTQVDCMKKLTSAIYSDVELLLKNSKELTHKCAAAEANLESLKNKYDENLAAGIESVQTELMKEKHEHENTRQLNKEKEHEIKTLHENVKNFENLVEQYKTSMKVSKEDRELLQKRVETLIKSQETLKSEGILWQKRFSDVYAKQDVLKVKCEHLQIKVSNLQNEMDRVHKGFHELDVRIAAHDKSLENNIDVYQNLFNKVKDAIRKKSVSYCDKCVETDEQEEPKKMSGDPVKDMNRQLRENRAKIKCLQEENKTLSKILERFAHKH